MHVSLSSSFLQALGDKREGAATVHFVQRGVKVLEGSKWEFGEVSINFELDRDRYGGDFMHDAILGFLASLICTQTMECIEGLDGCDLMRLTILPMWKSLFDASKITKIWNVEVCTISLGTRF
jgi:hypothetical protein